jgi:hypothetical protein
VDLETGASFQKILTKQGMKFSLSTKVTKSEVTATGVKLTTEPSAGGAPTVHDFDVVLVATGRRPVTAGLGLAELGITQDKLGRVNVDKSFKTNVAVRMRASAPRRGRARAGALAHARPRPSPKSRFSLNRACGPSATPSTARCSRTRPRRRASPPSRT